LWANPAKAAFYEKEINNLNKEITKAENKIARFENMIAQLKDYVSVKAIITLKRSDLTLPPAQVRQEKERSPQSHQKRLGEGRKGSSVGYDRVSRLKDGECCVVHEKVIEEPRQPCHCLLIRKLAS
jgi:hypothetical protein